MVDDAKKKKEDGDKEAPIDPENVNNPTEPMRIEEKVRKRKEKVKIPFAEEEKRKKKCSCDFFICKFLQR